MAHVINSLSNEKWHEMSEYNFIKPIQPIDNQNEIYYLAVGEE